MPSEASSGANQPSQHAKKKMISAVGMVAFTGDVIPYLDALTQGQAQPA